VRDTLSELQKALGERLGERLRALVVCGSLARGEYRSPTSDVHLLLVLEDTPAATLDLAVEPLRVARRRSRVQPYVVADGELARIADAFPIKVLDMKTYHVVLSGEDPLAGVAVEPEHLRLGVERALRNHVVRMRRAYLAVSGEQAAALALLRTTVESLRVELEALLHLTSPALGKMAAEEVFRRAATEFGFQEETLRRLVSLWRGDDSEPRKLLADALTLVEQAAEIADRFEVTA